MIGAHYPDLEGKAAIVTGGASGIGEAIALALATQGVKVTVFDVDKAAGAALTANNPAIRFDPIDVTDTSALESGFDRARAASGPTTLLVANAANDVRHHMDEVTPESWDAGMALNLRHQFFAARLAARDMNDTGGGAIVTMGSVSWRMGAGGMPGYVTAKAGVEGLTRTLARDLGPRNIRVNCVVPGWIMTQKQLDMWVTPEAETLIESSQALKRKLVPEDVARVVTFFLSEESGGCTGQSYLVDGGWV